MSDAFKTEDSFADVLGVFLNEDTAEAGAPQTPENDESNPAEPQAGGDTPATGETIVEGASPVGDATGEPTGDSGDVPGAGSSVPGETPPAIGGGASSTPINGGVTIDSAKLADSWSKITEGLETSVTKKHEAEVVKELQAEYTQYTDLVNAPARTLIGKDVPRVDGAAGTERIRDLADAKDYQETAQKLLVEEGTRRVQTRVEKESSRLSVLHSSVDLFQKNIDLIPNSKTFNKELATKVMDLARPYLVKEDGKMVGFSIDIQPLVNQVRLGLTPPAPAAPAAPAAPVEEPQQGLSSRSMSSGAEGEDFSDMYRAMGIL